MTVRVDSCLPRANSKGNDMWYILAWWFIGFVSMFIGDYADSKDQFKKYNCPTRLGVLQAGLFAFLGLILLIPTIILSCSAFGKYASHSNWWNKSICGKNR